MAERAQTLGSKGLVPISFELPQANSAPTPSVVVGFEMASAQDSDRRQGETGLRAVPNERRGDTSPSNASAQTAPSRPSALAQSLNAALDDPISVATVGLSVSVLWWLSRASGLMVTTIMLGTPAWRHVDLMPVLASTGEDDADEDSPLSGVDANGTDEADDAMVMLFEGRANSSMNQARGL